jgi:hypothetical protein
MPAKSPTGRMPGKQQAPAMEMPGR